MIEFMVIYNLYLNGTEIWSIFDMFQEEFRFCPTYVRHRIACLLHVGRYLLGSKQSILSQGQP